MKKSEELPEAELEAAEERPAPHHHGTLDDDGLVGHLRSGHGLDTADQLSCSTLDGIHDRLHAATDAAAD